MTAASVRGLSESEQDREFLQRRVALFGAAVGGGYLAFWLYRVGAMLYLDRADFGSPALWWHLAAGFAFLSMYLLLRGRARSANFISTTEMVSLTLGVLATSLMAVYIPPEARPDYILLLALTNVLLARSMFVPCTGQGTALFATIFGAMLLSCVYVGARRIDHDKWSTLYPELLELSSSRAALYATIEVGAYWVLTSAIAVAISSVIYGLRRRARDAEQLGQYRLEEKIGEGGMGAVFRARHAFLRRPTAVKLLPPEKAGAENLRRFEQEVQLTAELHHPNTITIFDYGHTAEGVFYYAMEYIDGLDMAALVARSGPQHPGRVVALMRQAASALIEAHGVGLVHRDIKPSNIMAQLLHSHDDAGDFVKVLDFGLVKRMRSEGGIELTNEADLSGTPQYMAPESIKSPTAVDARADVYALGAVAYFLLTGTHVFGGKTIVEVCSHHLHSAPEPPSVRLGTAIDPALEALVLQCLEKDPVLRPQSALEFKRQLALCDVPHWGPEDARRWWEAHGERRRPASPVPEEQMLTVDLQLDLHGGRA